MYTYNCKISRIIDGDTVDIDIDLGFDMWIKSERVRLLDIDAPETRTRDLVEKHFGLLSQQFVEKYLLVGEYYTFNSIKYNSRDVYGRSLGDFEVYDIVTDSWRSLTSLMLREGHAVKWLPDDVEEMKTQELNNRRQLIESGQVDISLKDAGLE